MTEVLTPVPETGIYPVLAEEPDVPVSMVATADLGRLAAEYLRSDDTADVVDVVGPDYSEREVAASIGRILGRDLQVVPVPRERWAAELMAGGMPARAAESVAEMYAAHEREDLAPRSGHIVRVTTGLSETLARLLARQLS